MMITKIGCLLCFCCLAEATSLAGQTTRVSVDSSGNQGNWHSARASISSDGLCVAFSSVATNLVAVDTNDDEDVFLHDRATGLTTCISLGLSGVQANRGSGSPSVSSDGLYVAFESLAANLVAGDANDVTDVFVRDRTTGLTTRASVDSSEIQGDLASASPSISTGGLFVAFESQATNLVTGDTNGTCDVFVRDRAAGLTTRISVDASGNQANSSSQSASISSDGRYVAFESQASNLVPGDANGAWDVFLHDRTTGETSRISVDSSGVEGNGGSLRPFLSSDARYVAFESLATNLVPGDTNGSHDVFVHDRTTGQTSRVSVDSLGNQGNLSSESPSISPDGRYVAFESYATDLVPGDVDAWIDVFVHDRTTGRTSRVSANSSGDQGDFSSGAPSISSDGRSVAFESYADNLVRGDTNGIRDVFVHERLLGGLWSK